MSKADKMFEDMGYKKTEDVNYIIYNVDTITITFFKGSEVVFFKDEIAFDYGDIKATFEKIKELGWIEL